MPSSNPDDDRMSSVELFLEGKGRFQYFFEKKESDIEVNQTNDSLPQPDSLVINECFHCHKGIEIPIETGCVDRSLLTRKNLSSLVDIKADTLYRHAKEVEANCKKALSLCMRNDSPYKNFNGTFPSGTNWMDYLFCIRKKCTSLETLVPLMIH
jgi:hypothetical protein